MTANLKRAGLSAGGTITHQPRQGLLWQAGPAAAEPPHVARLVKCPPPAAHLTLCASASAADRLWSLMMTAQRALGAATILRSEGTRGLPCLHMRAPDVGWGDGARGRHMSSPELGPQAPVLFARWIEAASLQG